MAQGMALQKKFKMDSYLFQKIMSASPEQLISYIYDAAIAACGKKDRRKANRAIGELITSLNFDHDKEVALTFFQMYRYINNLIYKGKFDEAQQFLNEIKKTWGQAFKVS